MARSVRFGVTIGPDTSVPRWRDMVRALEDSPVDVLLVNDHLSGLRYAPLPALSVAAALTSRIRLGTVVLANDYRHPAVLAKEIATLDLLSEGRVEVGIGSGWMRKDYEQAGLPFDTPEVRIRRLREAVRYLRGAWADEPFDFDGKYYQAVGLANSASPTSCWATAKTPPRCSPSWSACMRHYHMRPRQRVPLMPDVVVLDAARTAVGKSFRGSFIGTRSDDLGGRVIDTLLRRNPYLDPAAVTDCYWGCSLPDHSQG